jgi:nucleoside-diphosphate-sugar epimerase
VAEVSGAAPGRHDILVTGASGFIGRALCESLAANGHAPRRAVRQPLAGTPDTTPIGDIGPDTIWKAALEGVRCVVHLVARTHVLHETAADPLSEYRRVNVLGTERLAREAAANGVRRIIFLSSVKVNGERTATRPYTEEDTPRPEDAYGITKLEAEQALDRLAAETRLEIVVLRPPLVYGPGVKGNFLRLMDIVMRGVPLPFGSVANRRSLVYVGNLVDAITHAIDAPHAAGRTYLVSDGEDVSTPDLVRGIARALAVKSRLFPCPPPLLQIAGMLSGRGAEISRLTSSLQVDSSRIRRELGWNPRFRLEQGLAEAASWYRARMGART